MYISNGQHYTYGSKTYDQIYAISDPKPWSTVFCTTNYRLWWYHGTWVVWTTNDCAIMNYSSGNGTITTGTVVDLDTSFNLTCQAVSQSAGSAKPIGVVLDINASTGKASVAITGLYKGRAGDTITAGNGVRANTTNGTMESTATANGPSTLGAFGIARDDGTETNLVLVYLTSKRELY